MKSAVDKTLRKSFYLLKKLLMSNKTLSNAIMDVYNGEEFTDLYEHEKMLADSVRMEAYRKGISRHIKPGETVVDLGTGSGILSFFAAQNHPEKIYAIDHSEFIEVAKEIARRNGITSIEFGKVNSRSFTPPEKVDVILHEQIGDDLFDENMIENILDLKRRILKEDGRILPGKFELYLEPVSLKEGSRVPFIWEKKHTGIDFEFLKESNLTKKYSSHSYTVKHVAPYSIAFLLCDPQPVLSFDLNEDHLDLNIPPQKKIVINPGIMDGVCLYFRTIFDEDISFDTSPLDKVTSWGNRFFRTQGAYFDAGDTISFEVKMDSILLANTWELEFSQPMALA